MRIAFTLMVLAMTTGGLLMSQVPTQGERDRAMSYLHSTRKQFLDVVMPATPEQWKFKPVAGGWSIAEIAEHLAVTEEAVTTDIEKILQAPATPEKKSETVGKDEMIMKALPDRSRRVQSPEAVTPTGRWSTRDAVVTEFKRRRDHMIEFIEKTPGDLRSHMTPHPFLKQLDCYQWTLFLAAHTDRHVQQMREVMADPGFPKKP